jgi:amino acid adenylation domain-containing protein
MNWPLLHEAVVGSDREGDMRAAICWRKGTISHHNLRQSTQHIGAKLRSMGIGKGDRVAVCLQKSPEAIQAILGVLASGAAYVPVDPNAPAARISYIIENAEVSLVFTSAVIWSLVEEESHSLTAEKTVLVEVGSGEGLNKWMGGELLEEICGSPSDMAVMLYTSGSTGLPKGVMLSHENVSCFVGWAINRFGLKREDVFSSHAPLHFDLSTLDIFGSLRVGGSVFLFDSNLVKFPAAVAKLIQQHRISVWYSVPTALRMLLEHGGMARRDLSSLRVIFFAGEVFPVPSLIEFMKALPDPVYANLYGPTETNVCTYYVVEDVPAEEEKNIPIGVGCEHLEISIVGETGELLSQGETGEICVTGKACMMGYWKDPEKTDKSRYSSREDTYRTGDFGWIDPKGQIQFAGRRDHQIKIRGHRVELMEIESHLVRHDAVKQAAVVLSKAQDLEAELVAFVGVGEENNPSTESLREICDELPSYAVPARFICMAHLPETSTGKINRQALSQLAVTSERESGT